MKSIIVILLFVFCVAIVSAVTNLANVNFSTGSMPAGWTTTGTANWQTSNSANAGGTAYELKFTNSPATPGIRRYISPAYNVSDFFELQLQFRQRVIDNPASPISYTVGIQVSNDLSNWTDIWSYSTNDSFGPDLYTFPIPYANLNSTTFHFAFYFSGSPSDLLGWYIDDIKLDATRQTVAGTWTLANSPYYLTCDIGVPANQTLTIEPGVEVIATGQYSIQIDGSLRAIGTEADSIRFTAQDRYQGWFGILLNYSVGTPSVFSHCVMEFGKNIYENGSINPAGGMLTIYNTEDVVTVQHCRFSHNTGYMAGAICSGSNQDLVVDNCRFDYNSGQQASTINVSNYADVTFTNCVFAYNYGYGVSTRSHFYTLSQGTACNLIFDSNTMADNTMADDACLISGYDMMNMHYNSVVVSNSIFWNPLATYEIKFDQAFFVGDYPELKYCDIRGLMVYNSPPTPVGLIYSDPLFTSSVHYTIAGNSPCIDAGNPAMTDPDGSRKDMGAKPLWKKPNIIYVRDVPYDQGLKVNVFWNRSQADAGAMVGGFYSVFRVDNMRNNSGQFIDSPMQLSNLSNKNNIYWEYRNTVYHFMGEIPAFNFDSYALACATVQDSSFIGSNSALFVVVYRNSSWFAMSDPVAGYSVDNIAPDAVRNLSINREGSQARLSWNPVTTGTYNGNSYPEQHLVTYKIYCSDEADFEISSINFMTTVVGTSNLVNMLSADHKFYRIVATDQ